ncbi:hypothetical protein BGX34_004840 [Mortierella sp. NVP85]|nr:hypothetical protein BGX34_004840 [Mortierella sp. NVP85]
MSAFTLETVLDTKTPNVIEFLGSPSPHIQHSISGTLRLVVQKPIQFKQLSVLFLGKVLAASSSSPLSAKADDIDIIRIEVPIINAPTQYQPGEYSFPFQLTLPGDLVTTNSTKLKSSPLDWTFELFTTATPTGLFNRRKIFRQPLTLKRLHVPPSDTSAVRYSAKRSGQFECSIHSPRFISTQQKQLFYGVLLRPQGEAFRVKEIIAQAIQSEQINFNTKKVDYGPPKKGEVDGLLSDPEKAGSDAVVSELYCNLMNAPTASSNMAKAISESAIVSNPDQEGCSAMWGQGQIIDVILDLNLNEILPSESLDWIQISHKVRFTIVFADSEVRNLVVLAPFQIGHFLEESLSYQPIPDGLTPPDYSVNDGQSTVLDSNLTRISRQQLFYDQYPERGPVVPDLVDDMPPVYEDEGRRPSYSEKGTLVA